MNFLLFMIRFVYRHRINLRCRGNHDNNNKKKKKKKQKNDNKNKKNNNDDNNDNHHHRYTVSYNRTSPFA